VGLGPVVFRARVLVHEISRAEELAERRLGVAASITPGSSEVEEHRAGHVLLAAQGMEVKHVDAAELRIVIATVLNAAANAVLVAHHLPKICAHLITARPFELGSGSATLSARKRRPIKKNRHSACDGERVSCAVLHNPLLSC
jgi:hypothetical protein